jgi:hypothetical protein
MAGARAVLDRDDVYSEEVERLLGRGPGPEATPAGAAGLVLPALGKHVDLASSVVAVHADPPTAAVADAVVVVIGGHGDGDGLGSWVE